MARNDLSQYSRGYCRDVLQDERAPLVSLATDAGGPDEEVEEEGPGGGV